MTVVCCTDLGSEKHEVTGGLSTSGLWNQQVLCMHEPSHFSGS